MLTIGGSSPPREGVQSIWEPKDVRRRPASHPLQGWADRQDQWIWGSSIMSHCHCMGALGRQALLPCRPGSPLIGERPEGGLLTEVIRGESNNSDYS